MYTIGELCREFNLSRTALIYYDSIGLLTASGRTPGNYRQYSEDDKKRLGQISAFREAGVPLEQIKEILATNGKHANHILKRRLVELNHEIRSLRLQQKLIVEMLKQKNATTSRMLMDKETFVSILKSAGVDPATSDQFHARFEASSPDSHQFFLEFLGLPEAEITQIREYSRSG